MLDLPGRKKNSAVAQKLAIWFRLEGKTEACRSLLIGQFQRGIHSRRDEHINNDAEGYGLLAQVLFRAGNIEQAKAAITPLIFPFA